jgi:hypothetical protein
VFSFLLKIITKFIPRPVMLFVLWAYHFLKFLSCQPSTSVLSFGHTDCLSFLEGIGVFLPYFVPDEVHNHLVFLLWLPSDRICPAFPTHPYTFHIIVFFSWKSLPWALILKFISSVSALLYYLFIYFLLL